MKYIVLSNLGLILALFTKSVWFATKSVWFQ